MKTLFLKLLNIVLIILFLYIIFNSLFSNKLEGFSLNDIGKITDDVKNIGTIANSIPKKIDDLNKTIDTKFTDFEKKVEDKTTGIITEKFKSVFEQLGAIFNDGLIKPLIVLFNGIGNMFIQIFNILGLIVNKIISLPSCLVTYLVVESLNVMYNIYKSIVPNWLENIISTLYKYTIKIIVEFFKRILGIDSSIQRCYGFNINKEMESINEEFKKINDSFKNDFGKLNFNSIKF